VKIIPTLNAAGDKTSRVSAVYDAAPRKSFVAALKDVPEVWEISYDPNAEPIAEGLVHDYQYKEGHFKPAMFSPRRTCSRTISTISSSPRATTRFSDRRDPQPGDRSSSSTPARRSPTWTCPGCRTWVRESPGSGTTPGARANGDGLAQSQ
jgi:hypothetical protein